MFASQFHCMIHNMRSSRVLFLCFLLTLFATRNVVCGQTVTSPEAHLGRPLGTDFQLADWGEVSSWYTKLGNESPNVITKKIGTTTEGRDFLISIISSQENLKNLETLQRYSAIIADPRGHSEAAKREALEKGKVILMVSPQIHSTEAAGSEAAMKFAYTLATSQEEPWVSARENLVVGIFACTNPDGLDHVVKWYRKYVGTPYEATVMLELYQHYTGHDNNRDWFMLTQAETRIVTEQLYKVWHPHVYWDIHQQGSMRERMFVPPHRDPLNPNLDPAIVTGIGAIGSRAMHDLTRDGLTGISTGVSYDMWWNGGNRSVPVRHNIIGILTEAASVEIATPVFIPRAKLLPPRGLAGYHPSNQFPKPWEGGWWRLSDIINYQFSFGKSLVGSLAREPQFWLRNALEASERTIAKGEESGPRAWILPSNNRDPDAVRRLVDVLLLSGIELHVAQMDIEADGCRYPKGSIVILRNQPYSSHVKDLFDVQSYPEGEPPYDVSGWTLPMLLGVRRVEVMHPIETAALRKVDSVDAAVKDFAGDPRLAKEKKALSSAHSGSWTQVVKSLAKSTPVSFETTGENAGLLRFGEKSGLVMERLPRIGLYSPWSGNMDEGWMRWVLDTWEIPYVTVRNEQLRAGNLSDFIDVLLIPDVGSRHLDEGRAEGSVPAEFARGLAPEGAVAVEEFVRSGGTLVTLGDSSQWAIDLLRLPLVDVTREKINAEFSCPGSVLRAIPASNEALTAGLPESMAVFFSGSRAWREFTDEEFKKSKAEKGRLKTLLYYAPTRVLLSGWIAKPEIIAGRSAWVEASYGKGRVHLFGFRPQYRAWSQGTFQLVFRAMLMDGNQQLSKFSK